MERCTRSKRGGKAIADYPRFRRDCGVTNTEMIDTLKEHFPKYSKSTMTMVNNPDDYAVQLLPEAERILAKKFGASRGLSIYEHRRSYDHGNRAKPNRLYVRLDDAVLLQVKELMSRMHFAFMQDLIEAALLQFVDKYAATQTSPVQGEVSRRDGGVGPRKGWGR